MQKSAKMISFLTLTSIIAMPVGVNAKMLVHQKPKRQFRPKYQNKTRRLLTPQASRKR